MNHTSLTIDVTDKVARLTFSQPEQYNRMTPAFWRELPEAIAGLDAQGDVRALIIASSGKHFSAGMDLSVFTDGGGAVRERGRAGEAGRRNIARFQDAFSIIERVRMPVLAVIQGGCIGGGVDLISTCDMRYCTADAFFCIQEINIGMAADVGTLQRLPKLIPDGIMRELAYTGRRMYAEEAKSIGLVNEVFDTQEGALEAVQGIAREIASKSPLAVTSSKEMLRYSRDHTVEDALKYQQLWMGAVSQGGDMGKYFNAKAEGEEPEFDDLAPLDE
ncbi:MAG: crotonase/enoyl-CoA hydratase family protein [Gammaproteobacteria bacterium]|nr:crotonase/enoyl-CoA hydratase family protein [Gammaproteobacteria bacterium]